MKKTVNINLGGIVFQIDEDAYDRLHLYIITLKKKFRNSIESEEIIQDIEYRFAELFSEDISSKNQVVSLEMVSKAINTLGTPEEIEDEEIYDENQATLNDQIKSKKLFRDPDNQIFAGVVSGVSKYFGVQDAVWLRIALVLITLFSTGFTFLIYIILWIVMPMAKTASDRLQMNGEPITLGNIEDEVKNYTNSGDKSRTTARIANKLIEVAPVIGKILAVFLVIFFLVKIFALTVGLVGGSFALSLLSPGYSGLLVNSKSTAYLAIFSFYLLISTPLFLALYLSIKVFTKKKINWVITSVTVLFLMIFSFIGLGTSGYTIIKGFKVDAEQINYVALENPNVQELNIEFPFKKIIDDVKMNISIGNNFEGDNIKFDGFKVYAERKEIHINNVELDIKLNKMDTVFKLSKTMKSQGLNIEDAEEKIGHITNDFENLTENTISIPRLMILKDETKWRAQRMKYDLYIPLGKRVYFGDNAKKVVDDVDFNGDYYKKDLRNNTWEMTKQGLKCITCNID